MESCFRGEQACYLLCAVDGKYLDPKILKFGPDEFIEHPEVMEPFDQQNRQVEVQHLRWCDPDLYKTLALTLVNQFKRYHVVYKANSAVQRAASCWKFFQR